MKPHLILVGPQHARVLLAAGMEGCYVVRDTALKFQIYKSVFHLCASVALSKIPPTQTFTSSPTLNSFPASDGGTEVLMAKR
jgi:hypothetical protein